MALPQPLHIFRKDLMHLWPETLFVVALFVAFCFVAPLSWPGGEYSNYAVLLTLLGGLLKILMIISWLVLITRAIQDESLVGDRQFWTSRPYHWAKLLAAKAIFLGVCIYLPFFLMQVYLLKHAGLHPMMVIPALLHNLVLLTVVFIVPLAALAAVTSTFPRLLLSFLGTVIYMLVVLGILFWWTLFKMQPPHLDWLANSIFIGFPAIALLIQYSRRETTIARALLIATPLLAVLIYLVVPTTALIAHAYPNVSGASAPKLASVTDRFPVPPAAGELLTLRKNVGLSIPVSVEGVDKDTSYVVTGTRVTATASGVSVLTPFMTVPALMPPTQISAGRPIVLLTFPLPREAFDQLRSKAADVHIQLASEAFKTEKPSTWRATLLPFSVPGNGVCSFPREDTGAPPICRFPLAQPENSFVTAQLAAGSCTEPAAPAVLGQGSLSGGTSTVDFDPVVTAPLRFQTGDPNTQHNYVLCPGAALNFVEGSKLPNVSLNVDLKGIVLDPYAARMSANGPRKGRVGGQPGQPAQPPAQPEPEP